MEVCYKLIASNIVVSRKSNGEASKKNHPTDSSTTWCSTNCHTASKQSKQSNTPIESCTDLSSNESGINLRTFNVSHMSRLWQRSVSTESVLCAISQLPHDWWSYFAVRNILITHNAQATTTWRHFYRTVVRCLLSSRISPVAYKLKSIVFAIIVIIAIMSSKIGREEKSIFDYLLQQYKAFVLSEENLITKRGKKRSAIGVASAKATEFQPQKSSQRLIIWNRLSVEGQFSCGNVAFFVLFRTSFALALAPFLFPSRACPNFNL